MTTLRKAQIGNEMLIAVLTPMLLGSALAQQPSPSTPERQAQVETIVVPEGTQIPMVLTHPVDSKTIGRTREIYAQLSAPVTLGGKVVIPAGAFIQGRLEKVVRHGARGELIMQSLSLVFPDGYVANFTGPASIETTEGTVWIDPSGRSKALAVAAPPAGLGLGTLIGSLARTTQTSTLGGTTITTRSPKALAIGGAVGLAIGGAISLALIFGSHQYYIEVGSPMEMTLSRPWTITDTQGAGQDPPAR